MKFLRKNSKNNPKYATLAENLHFFEFAKHWYYRKITNKDADKYKNVKDSILVLSDKKKNTQILYTYHERPVILVYHIPTLRRIRCFTDKLNPK